MPSQPISLIGVPTDIGAGARGASMGPEALRVAGLAAVLENHGLAVTDRGNLGGPPNPWQGPVDGHRHLTEVLAWNQALHHAVTAELADERFRSGRWHATAGPGVGACACCGWTPTPISTPPP